MNSHTVQHELSELHINPAPVVPAVFVHLHGGGGQVRVLVLQMSVQRQTSFLLVLDQQGGDGQRVLVGAAGLHRLSEETQANPHMNTFPLSAPVIRAV